jgi:hypothetical protein
MKKIAIYCFVPEQYFKWDENNYYTGRIGGSEIWAIKLSEEFAKRGYDVCVFANPEVEHKTEKGVSYFNTASFKKVCNEKVFDYIILSRTLEPIDDIKNCDNIYLMCHDIGIVGTFDFTKFDKIKKVFCQSKFQRELLQKKYNLSDSKIAMTFEAIDQNLYDFYNGIEKKNKMLFSSGFGRGVRFFVENIFPRIKKEVPDFEVDICSYNDSGYRINSFKQDGINVFGSIPKDDLVRKQCESKIWVYPNHGYDYEFNRNDETFSITAVENAYAKNACILGKWGCFASTLDGYDGFVCGDLYDNDMEPIEYDKLDEFYDELAKDAIKCLTDEEYRLSKVNSSYELVKKYTWPNAADTFENVFNQKDEDVKVLLCCIGRLENKYIREYVDYNKAMGFTKICLYDNNRDGEEDFHDVIGDYIDSGYVILKDYRNITVPCQFRAYNECYEEYGKKYDWIAFLDIDEFVFLNNHKNIKDYLSDKIFDNFDMIHLNWLLFGDGDMVYDNGLPLLARIKTPLDINLSTGYNIPDTFHIKSIIRGGLDSVDFSQTPHTPINDLRCCNSFGIECPSNSPFAPYDFRNGGLLHFTTKTAEEFAEKVKRGFCDGNPKTKRELVELFFKRNKITKEKINIIKEKTGIDVSYLLPYDGEKNKDIQIFSLCYERKDFKFLDDSVVTPLQVGAVNNQNVCNLKDNTGDNISSENFFFIESTGTYWIWKNINDAKYKGQMQYRRPLEGVNETMDFNDIFSKYDVITCKPFNHPENSKPTKEQPMCIPAQTVEEGYRFSNCIDDLYILEIVIKHYHPEYAEDYDKYIKKGENLYYSNGFIMKAEDYDRYSEFLFDCLRHYLDMAQIHSFDDLIDHVKYNIETGKYIRYEKEQPTDGAIKWQSEIGGFLSERIWTLWLQHNFVHDKIYELPYIKMEENMYT